MAEVAAKTAHQMYQGMEAKRLLLAIPAATGAE